MRPEIDLNKYLPEGVKLFSGRDWGEKVRVDSKIDDVFAESTGKIRIIIPVQIRSINPSFLEELLANVVAKYGREDFLERVEFTQATRYHVKADLDEAIDRILTEENALAI